MPDDCVRVAKLHSSDVWLAATALSSALYCGRGGKYLSSALYCVIASKQLYFEARSQYSALDNKISVFIVIIIKCTTRTTSIITAKLSSALYYGIA